MDQVESEVDTFERHVVVLGQVVRNQPVGVINLARETGYTRCEVRYSLRVLEEEGAIKPTNRGQWLWITRADCSMGTTTGSWT